MKPLSILYIAYPLLTVTPESAGGAEQMLLTVEREIYATGNSTTVAASSNSRVNGTLLNTGPPVAALDHYEDREREHSAAILKCLRSNPDEFDLIHDMSGSFFRYAAQCPVPILATLHLPRSFYREQYFGNPSPNVYFNCVSQSQAASFTDLLNFLGVVENGITVEDFPLTTEKDSYLFWLGRICEEKAPHLAITVAQKASLTLVIAGQVYPFRYHQDYFDREIRPHFNNGSSVRFVDTPTRQQKLELLSRARALLLTSTVEETSSLVAMEAMACGTPVLAFRRGAFLEVVANGETGILVDTLDELAAAISDVQQISPGACRARVEHYFDAKKMARDYERLYRQILNRASKPIAA